MNTRTVAENAIREMTRFCRTRFDLPHFVVHSRLSSSSRRRRSWGGQKNGVGYISIQLNRYDPTKRAVGSMTEYLEYACISKHPTIGNFVAAPEICTLATVAHEIAHAVDYYVRYWKTEHGEQKVLALAGDFRNGREFKGHTRSWQFIYHVLREEFVNKSASVVQPINTMEVQPRLISRPQPFSTRARIAKVAIRPEGKTNIARVCEMYRGNKGKSDGELLLMIQTMLNVKFGNAKIYLAKAKERTL